MQVERWCYQASDGENGSKRVCGESYSSTDRSGKGTSLSVEILESNAKGRAYCYFDRTWYGRVMVERIEGFSTAGEWQRAYQEINDMEKICMMQVRSC